MTMLRSGTLWFVALCCLGAASAQDQRPFRVQIQELREIIATENGRLNARIDALKLDLELQGKKLDELRTVFATSVLDPKLAQNTATEIQRQADASRLAASIARIGQRLKLNSDRRGQLNVDRVRLSQDLDDARRSSGDLRSIEIQLQGIGQQESELLQEQLQLERELGELKEKFEALKTTP